MSNQTLHDPITVLTELFKNTNNPENQKLLSTEITKFLWKQRQDHINGQTNKEPTTLPWVGPFLTDENGNIYISLDEMINTLLKNNKTIPSWSNRFKRALLDELSQQYETPFPFYIKEQSKLFIHINVVAIVYKRFFFSSLPQEPEQETQNNTQQETQEPEWPIMRELLNQFFPELNHRTRLSVSASHIIGYQIEITFGPDNQLPIRKQHTNENGTTIYQYNPEYITWIIKTLTKRFTEKGYI